MENDSLSFALAAISSGEYNQDNVKTIKSQIDLLSKKELCLKRQMEKNKNEFVKTKDKEIVQLRNLRNNIKQLKNVLNKIK